MQAGFIRRFHFQFREKGSVFRLIVIGCEGELGTQDVDQNRSEFFIRQNIIPLRVGVHL